MRSDAELCAECSSAGWQSSALESRANEPALPGLQGSAWLSPAEPCTHQAIAGLFRPLVSSDSIARSQELMWMWAFAILEGQFCS